MDALRAYEFSAIFYMLIGDMMVFSSMLFLWLFLPIILVLTRLAYRSVSLQNVLLLGASLFFYAWGEPRYVVLMMASILLNFLSGLLLEAFPANRRARRLVLAAAVLANLAVLGYFKYFDFFAGMINQAAGREVIGFREIALPIGISFFTFQAMSYVIDLYRGEYPAQRNILNLALYISFFPQLIAGPIVRYRDIGVYIRNRRMTSEATVLGIRRFIYGLTKKVLIANTLAESVDRIYGFNFDFISSPMAWTAAVFYALQIYYDFSGYSDMAIGLGKMFGFPFLENFDYPYLSGSVREFWRRWHISLSTWFREYLYIPLGGSRKGVVRTYGNLLAVFLATGLWHGASTAFVIWGLWHGAFLIAERMGLEKLLERARGLRYVYTGFAVLSGWVLFRAAELHPALRMLKRMYLPWQFLDNSMYHLRELVPNRAFAAAAAGIVGMGLIQAAVKRFCPNVERWKYGPAEFLYCMALLAWSILRLAGNTYNPFIYFRF